MVDHSLVSGSYLGEAHRLKCVEGTARAIGRARSQRCALVQDLPPRERTPLREAHPTVYLRVGTEALILDKRCRWSNSGYAESSMLWQDAIPKCALNEVAAQDDIDGAVLFAEGLRPVSDLQDFLVERPPEQLRVAQRGPPHWRPCLRSG